jgi:FixJ family two-component response regulator
LRAQVIMPQTVAADLARRPRLLLIDDDAAVRRSLQLLLQGRGFNVRAFGSAVAALRDDLACRSDILITDYLLPDGDGIAVIETLRQQAWRGRAVLITAFPSSILAKRAIASGFDALLEKPLHHQALITAIGAHRATP